MEVFFFIGLFIIIFSILCFTGIINMSWGEKIVVAFIMFFVLFVFCPICPYCVDSCRSIQSEAKSVLGAVATGEETYFCEFGRFTNDLSIRHFKKAETNRYYNFSIQLSDDSLSFLAFANSKAPGLKGCGEGDDVWTIDNKRTMSNPENACQKENCGWHLFHGDVHLIGAYLLWFSPLLFFILFCLVFKK